MGDITLTTLINDAKIPNLCQKKTFRKEHCCSIRNVLIFLILTMIQFILTNISEIWYSYSTFIESSESSDVRLLSSGPVG